MRLALDASFEVSYDKFVEIFLSCIGKINFSADTVQIFVNSTNDILTAKFDPETLDGFMQRKPASIKLSTSGDGTLKWFKGTYHTSTNVALFTFFDIQVDDNDDFLIERYFSDFSALIFACVYDQVDVVRQSRTDIDFYIRHFGQKPKRTTRDYLGEKIVDISQHWGRSILKYGLEFLAAPIMWFGPNSKKIYPIDSLMNLSFGKKTLKDNEARVLQIKLFDAGSNPDTKEVRQIQQMFWEEVKLETVAENYEKLIGL